MRKDILFLFLLCCYVSNNLYSQSFINTGQLVQTGNYIVLAGGTKWQNNGTANLQSGSEVLFSGNATQEIDGTNPTAFANLRINNSSTYGVVVNRNIQVLGTLTMQTGYLDLKNNEVDLSTTGTLTGETETSRVRATNSSWAEGGGTGRLKATRTNPSGNVAGLGLTFTPSTNMGNTVIYRGHQSQTGPNLSQSIFRYFEIQPSTYATLTVNPFSYFDAELNGITPESDLRMLQLYNSSNYWQLRPYVSHNTTTNQLASNTASNSLSYIKVTLAKSPCTMTASAGSNSPICQGSTLNLTVTPSGGYGTLTYSWTGPNGFTSTQQNPSISNATPSASGTYNVTITDELNCTATASVAVTVNPTNTITLTSAPSTTNQTVCINTPITNITYSTTGATGANFTGLPAGVTGNFNAGNITIS
ncbi:MAG: PKD domain-containing protein, partial [Bacteroidales bacterium]|nr:PKD domain-containing protein [Bacteroidales bacterium]